MRRKKKYWVLLLCVLLLLTGMWYQSPARQMLLRPVVSVESAKTSDVVLSVYFKGTVYDENQKELYLAEPACVTGVYAEVGDTVSAGDLLLTARLEENVQDFPQIGNDVLSVFQEWYGTGESRSDAIYCYAEDGEIYITSPIDGVLSEFPLQSGVSQPAGALCATVSDPNNLKICASVPEIYIQDLQAGMTCEITGEAFRDQTYQGSLELIMPYATTTQTLSGKGETVVEVLIGIENPDDALRAGYNARVEIDTERHEDAVIVPYEAIEQDRENQEYVFVYQDGVVTRRLIETGAELESAVEVLSGLSEGEFVVTDSTKVLTDGDRVKAVQH